ncbi:hypothetical protein J7481_25145 [Labrenzia sp. R4_2]|uniref:hypothetical protein n=1 Tax=Labrenzia sp. R4_2 TaxID=2821107 RepID=UPI001ADBD440|nr:hypothetical protein [Labrenzia sp. R4_2]MBO9422816.1 hypothetical protein [Labrenzia sp. R4_2]
MERSLALFAIGLVFGGGIGFVVAASNGVALDGHDHSSASDHQMQTTSVQLKTNHSGQTAGHDHNRTTSVPGGPDAPSLKISVSQDPVSGYNLHIMTENFTFAPERAGLDHVLGEGHAHVYVNGVKVARHYSAWLHLPTLPKGDATVEVTLNSNDHRMLAVETEPLKAAVTVNVE